jgi:hypothetical protein
MAIAMDTFCCCNGPPTIEEEDGGVIGIRILTDEFSLELENVSFICWVLANCFGANAGSGVWERGRALAMLPVVENIDAE